MSYYSGGGSAVSSYGGGYNSYAQQNYSQQSYGHGYQQQNYDQNVTIPPLPYQDNYYQLEDKVDYGGTGYINNHYSQNYFIKDKVVVNDFYKVTPYHDREYVYGGVHASQNPLISTTSGCIPPYVAPNLSFSYGGGYQQQNNYQSNYGGGGYMKNSMYAPGGATMTNQMWG